MWLDAEPQVRLESRQINYLHDEAGQPYAGIYREPSDSTAPVVFGLVTTGQERRQVGLHRQGW